MVREAGNIRVDPDRASLAEPPAPRDPERLRRRAILLREMARARMVKDRLAGLPNSRRLLLRREYPT